MPPAAPVPPAEPPSAVPAAAATVPATSEIAPAVTSTQATTLTAAAEPQPRSYRLVLTARAAMRTELVSAFPVDRDGNELDTAPGLLFQGRVGALIHHGQDPRRARWMAEFEADVRGTPTSPDLEGAGLPYEQDATVELRRAYGRHALAPWLHLAAGAMTNHWGLGLVGNDGAHGWTPENARFADQVSGDRVARFATMIGPFPALGGVLVVGAADYVLGDDVLLDDNAVQAVGAVQVGVTAPVSGGLYVARRYQWTDMDYELDAWVVDAAFRAELPKRATGGLTVTLEGEGALITGETSLAPTMDYPVQDVLQLGGALRATVTGARYGGVLDVLFASGDQNLYDDTQHGFRPDPNYDMGLLLYRVVLAGQSGRGAGTAGDPELVGYPAQGVDRIPTRGSATNTVAVFPRAVYRPAERTVVYGGPLLAFAPVHLTDPFASRIEGSHNLNALGGEAGHMLGIELDVGVRHQLDLGPARLSLGLEAGALLPGDAFTDASGDAMAPVWGGRVLLQATR